MLKKNIKNLIQDNLESGDNIWSAQKTKEYIELLTTGALLYQGLYNPVTNVPNLTTLPNGVNFGYVFVISQAGTFYGEKVEIGDMIISNEDEPSSLANWDILQTNLDPDTLGLEFFNELDVTPLPNRKFLRVFEFLKVEDNPTTQEYELKIDPTKLGEFLSDFLVFVDGQLKPYVPQDHLMIGGPEDLGIYKTIPQIFESTTEEVSPSIFHVVDGKLELLVEDGEIVLGDALNRGRSSSIVSALGSLSKEVGLIFGLGVDGKLQILGTPGHMIRFNANGEGVSEPFLSGANKTKITDESGNEVDADLISFLDLLTATDVTTNGVLNTIDLGGTARGVLGSWKITDLVIKNTTANQVHINLGTTPGGNDILNNFQIDANVFKDDITLFKSVFSETVEQSIYISSSNWNSANLIIKFSVKKVF